MSRIPDPVCRGLSELPSAYEERARLNALLLSGHSFNIDELPPLSKHVALGLTVTSGSALGELPPSREECLSAFNSPNGVGLSAGARAWTKHSHRSGSNHHQDVVDSVASKQGSWWGHPKGSVATLNAGAVAIFDRIMDGASWNNLHWLPHMILVYEVRVPDGYGMRWSQDRSLPNEQQSWTFRGFVEPMMENGHDLGWRH